MLRPCIVCKTDRFSFIKLIIYVLRFEIIRLSLCTKIETKNSLLPFRIIVRIIIHLNQISQVE